MKKDYLDNRLTEEQKWMIRRDFRAGVQQKALAINYGVSEATISLVCHPETYERKKELQRERYRKKKEGA
jgi:hypothetical protein